MKFGRKLSFTGHRILLDFNLRQRLCKDLIKISSLGTVTVYDKHPTKTVGAQVVATLTPEICSTGRLIAKWDIPENLKCGTYYDYWEGFSVEGSTSSVNKVQQFYVSSDLYSMEPFLKPEYDIELCTDTLFTDTVEYVVFKMKKPETMIFPDASIRLFKSTVAAARLELTTRTTGPGLNFPEQTNAAFPQEAIIIADVPVTAVSEFLPISTYCDEAYFLLDSHGVQPGLYYLQLKLNTGEVEQVIRPLALRMNAPDLGNLQVSAEVFEGDLF